MSYFSTYQKAKDWADNYGYNYNYTIRQNNDGLFYVVWDYREPEGI